MEYLIIIGLIVLTIIVLKIGLNVKLNCIKKVKEIGYDKELNNLTNKFPENKEVCREILKQLGNENVKIEESEQEKGEASFYIAISNKIIIANIKDTFTRIQTIAHECIHSIQNRKTLLFNFIFSNIYLLYFIVIVILTFLKVINKPMIPLIVLILFSLIYYIVRSLLETEAMSKAPYIAKEYMQNSKLATQEEINIIVENYHNLNKIGIPLINFRLILGSLIKIIIYCIIAVVMI